MKENTQFLNIMKLESLLASFFFLIFETRSHYTAQICLELEILLPLPPKCWDYGVYHHIWL
jgi:hypothetical protein